MQFSKLRLLGFKSFVEPTDFDILPGLTGVIGPNGCGKSNLVEALRWVMGESSYKSMRASGMDDVIFAGGGSRPARNVAEVGLTLDNSTRTAPAGFNDADVLEVTRRIERDHGSTYRINGREVRARDVQILFADASSGSRSPALVRQGQIAEIIAAKPQARRRVLEEAAGVGGLHTRRHEAELRLKGAEDNLLRIDDVLNQIATQSDGLRRQARQARRFTELQADIRRLLALATLLEWEEAGRELAISRAALTAAQAAVVERTRAQGEAARHQAVAAHALPALRETEAEAGRALQSVLVARQALDGEEKRAKARQAELDRRIAEMTADLTRDAAALNDATAVLARLAEEEAALAGQGDDAGAETALRADLAQVEAARAEAEAKFAAAQGARAEAAARRRALDERARDDDARLARAARDLDQATAAHSALQTDAAPGDAVAADQLASASDAAGRAEAAARDADAALDAARSEEAALRGPWLEADRAVQRLDTEVRTLAKLLESGGAATWPRVSDALAVAKGYEAALGAALGDDLDASSDAGAPAHWAPTDAADDPTLPGEVEPLSRHVEAPTALRRRLDQIGLVARDRGQALRARLRPGQRLVSREGDVWRWDGFTQAAEAPTPAARRLAERNRLADLRREAETARRSLDASKAAADAARLASSEAATRATAARTALAEARRRLDVARDAHAGAQRRQAERATRLAGAIAAQRAAMAARDEAAERKAASDAALAALPPSDEHADEIAARRGAAEQLRAREAGLRASLQSAERDRDARRRRLTAIAGEQQSWQERAAQAQAHRATLDARLADAQGEAEALAEAPDRFVLARRRILSEVADAEAALRAASDARTLGETALAEADRSARAALEAMAAAREEQARGEAQVEAADQRAALVTRTASTDLECQPAALPALAGVRPDEPRPAAAEVAGKLAAAKLDRDRLGAVNLRAEDELAAMDTQRTELDQERADLTEAIRRLRQAIGSLNKEGRERLLAAFDRVNGHFKALFTTLFDGGSAELQLVESDDPLEAGLEILARPPGKKPQVMTLLSGGEQALTAISLIFAVFLTNPSPICVLDEVDAPLDDANVERFCDLVEAMRSKTETRFIAITHNPITMARMDRLCGVTQAERGVSQLVSVDLMEATELLEAS